MKLEPAVPGQLALSCFANARALRYLDMRASPYDLSRYGESAIRIETAAGKAEYVAAQRRLTSAASRLRQKLVDVCDSLLEPGEAAEN